MSNILTLKEVAEAPVEQLLSYDSKRLRNAFDRAGPDQAMQLQVLIERVCELRADTQEQGRLVYEWQQEDLGSFVRGLDASVIEGMARTVGDLDSRLRFAATLFRTPARHRLIAPLLQLGLDITAQAPVNRPDDHDDARRWSDRFRSVYDLLSVLAATETQRIEELLSATSSWLRELFYADLGRLQYFYNFTAISRLATATIKSGSRTARSVAASLKLTNGPTLRLADLLRVVGTLMRDGRRQWPWEPPAVTVQEWIAFFEQELRGTPNNGRELLSFVRQCEVETDVIAGTIAAYLSALPTNHEDVFELMTLHADPNRGAPLSDWGGPTVTVTTSGSMRKGSIASKLPEDAVDVAVPLSVQSSEVLSRTSADALVALTLEQSNPEFALTYLGMIVHSHHPARDEIVKRVCEDSRFISRLRTASGNMAGVVLVKLSNIRYGQGPLRMELSTVYGTLIDRVPTALLPAVARDAWFLENENRTLLLDAVMRRVPTVTSLPDLDRVLDIATELSVEEEPLRAALDLAPWNRLVPPPSIERDDFELWAARFSQAVSPRERVLERLMPVLSAEDIGRVYGAEWYGVGHGMENPNSIDQRLLAKAVLLRELMKRDPVAALEIVKKHAERDFSMLFASRLVMWNEQDTPPARVWLDAVREVSPELAQAHANTLLLHVWARRDNNKLVASVPTVEPFVRKWLQDNSARLPDGGWKLLLDRIDRLKDDDYDGAAAIAAMDLPSDDGDRRTFLERAVPKVRARMHASAVVARTESVAKLRDAIDRVAPHLSVLLDPPYAG
jgi:hypothetical protein